MDAGLVIAISLAVAFAVTNGLHDAANAIATLVGLERSEDDVSLFLLNEFVVQVQASEEGETVVEDIEAQAEEVEEQLVEVEEKVDDPTKAAERGAARLTPDD